MSKLNQDAYKIALKEEGVSEILGSAKNNPKIVEYHQACDLKAKDDETAWCSAFVNWCVQRAGGKGTRSAMARSWLDWGQKSDGNEGDIVILRRGKNPIQGHVGFLVSKGWFTVTVFGGNQNNCVCYSTYLRLFVLGYRESFT